MRLALISDEEIQSLRESIAKLSSKKALGKWQLCQRVFALWKQAAKDKKLALEERKAALMSHSDYKAAHKAYMDAKKALEVAEAVAKDNDDVLRKFSDADNMRFLRSEEEKIFKDMFDRTALAVKKDPLQVGFNLFVENDNADTHNRFGTHFRYELDVEGVGRFYRGKNGKSPSEEAKEIEKLQKDPNNYVSPEIRKLATAAGLEGYEEKK